MCAKGHFTVKLHGKTKERRESRKRFFPICSGTVFTKPQKNIKIFALLYIINLLAETIRRNRENESEKEKTSQNFDPSNLYRTIS